MKLTLQELLDELAKDGGGDLAGLLANPAVTRDTLDGLEHDALSQFDAIRKDVANDDDVAALEAIADVVKGIRAAVGARDAAAAELSERAEKLAADILPTGAGDADGTGNDGDGRGTDADAVGEEPVTDGAGGSSDAGEAPTPDAGTESPAPVGEPAGSVEAPAVISDAPAGDTPPAAPDGGAGGSGGGPVATDTAVPEPVAASGGMRPTRRKVRLADYAGRVPRPTQPTNDATGIGQVLVAAADVPGVPSGKRLDTWGEAARALTARFNAMPKGRAGGTKRLQYGFATIEKPAVEGLVASGGVSDTEAIDRAADEHRLTGGSLVAAGGWCGPAERWTDLCPLDIDLTGLFDLPTITVTRGRVEYAQGPDFCSLLPIVEQGFFHMTAEQVDAGEEKPCVEVPCPEDLLVCEQDVYGLCITAGILTQRSYPEWVAQFLRFALAAHELRMSAAKLDAVVAGSTDLGTIGTGAPNAVASVLNAIALQVEWLRERNRTNQSFELVAPSWLREVLRADIAKREGLDIYDVTDARIEAWFTLRGVRVQWLRQWQRWPEAECPDESPGSAGESPGDMSPGAGDTSPKRWPSSVQFLLYPAGTWVAAAQDVITLSTIYDSTLLRTNRYQALFSEEALCIIERCPGSWKFNVPLCPNGSYSAPMAVACDLP